LPHCGTGHFLVMSSGAEDPASDTQHTKNCDDSASCAQAGNIWGKQTSGLSAQIDCGEKSAARHVWFRLCFLGFTALFLGFALVLSSTGIVGFLTRKLLEIIPEGSSTKNDTGRTAEWQYEIIMDAGSSGTRVHVYQYTSRAGEILPRIQHPEATLKQEPGLSTLEPGQVCHSCHRSLVTCLLIVS
jgi:hypothetical protein